MSNPQSIAALVQTGSANRPALASRLERAADILRTNPPHKVDAGDPRLWHVPSAQREHVIYLVDRDAKSCTCPDYRQHRNTPRRGAPGGLCKHRLAVEILCRLWAEPHPGKEK